MGLYTVTEPCVIGQLHYATVPAQPIEVDDAAATELVEAGSLVPYRAAVEAESERTRQDDEIAAGLVAIMDTDPPVEAARPRTRRRAAED